MRVLCSTPPIEGVFGPFIPLGRALVEAGHEVIVASGADLKPRAAENGLRLEQAGLTAMEGALRAFADAEVKAAPPGDRIRFPAAMFGSVIPGEKLPALRSLASSRPPDLVVHPPVDLAGPLLAAELGLSSVCYGFAQPFDTDVLAAMAARARPLWEAAGIEPDAWAGVYRGGYLDPCPPALGGHRGVQAAGGAQPIRPEIPGNPNASLPDWADRLGDRPVVYISLGTAPLFNQPQKFAPLLAGLAGEDLELVVTVSELHDPSALGELPPNVHAERWLPLAPLLPRCDAVLCHGGTGTTLAALAAGLPLVLVPQGADQFDNARACQRAGAARVLAPSEVTAEATRAAVRAVLPNQSPERQAARAVASEIAAMPPAPTSPTASRHSPSTQPRQRETAATAAQQPIIRRSKLACGRWLPSAPCCFESKAGVMPALASNAPLSSISTVLGWTIGAPALVEEQRSASGLRLSLSQRLVAVGRGERVFHAAGGGREL